VKEYRHIVREPRTLVMVFLLPAMVLVTLALIFTNDGGRIDVAVWDQDRTSLSRQFAATLSSDSDFAVDYVADYSEIEAQMVEHRVDAAIVIPPGFGDTVQQGSTAPVQVILDGVDTFIAGKATGSLLGHAASFGVALSKQLAIQPPPLRILPQSVYLPDTAKLDSMVPGLIPVVLSLPVLAISVALAREHETGSQEALITTPVRGIEYLGGKLVAYVTTALLGLGPIWLVATVLFGVPFHGSGLVLGLLTVDFLLASMGMAVFIGNLVRSQQAATIVSLLAFFVPGFFLGGLLEPIDTSNTLSAAISYLLPTTHFVQICRAVFLKGATLFELWQPAAALFGIAVVWLVLGGLTFSKKLH
jgi:ABC-2 type transport system permease protein